MLEISGASQGLGSGIVLEMRAAEAIALVILMETVSCHMQPLA